MGLRYELDTDVKNVSRVDELNPLILPFLHGTRGKDNNNFAPRVGFNYANDSGDLSIHGGYGIYYDRITLEIQSLERGLDGRALPVEVRAGNLFFIPPPFLFDPVNGEFPPGAPTLANPFTGFLLPGAGAGGINIIDNGMQNPMVQQMNSESRSSLEHDYVLRVDYLHNFGTHFIIGRAIGQVFNPVVGGPDVVKNLESSVKTKYDGLLVGFEKRLSKRTQFRAGYTLSKIVQLRQRRSDSFLEWSDRSKQSATGVWANAKRSTTSLYFRGCVRSAVRICVSLRLSLLASGVPMDILVPDGSQRIPQLQRNAGGRLFHSAAELNAFIQQVNAGGGFARATAAAGFRQCAIQR